jgi:uncharacterized protein (UPF0335 family)
LKNDKKKFFFLFDKFSNTSSKTRQSIETIERINSENIRLHGEMKDLRHSLVN